jgi:hypothetical protein
MGCTIFPKLAAKTKREEKAKGEIHPQIRKIKGGSSSNIIGQKIFGGQQGDGRVFNTKFSKALHA